MKLHAVAISVLITEPAVDLRMEYQLDESQSEFGCGGENEILGSC